MKFTIVCDESGLGERQMIIGALIVPRNNHILLIQELKELKAKYHLRWEGEFKWGKVSKRYLPKYEAVIQWFFEHLKANHLRFRAHVIDTGDDGLKVYQNGRFEMYQAI